MVGGRSERRSLFAGCGALWSMIMRAMVLEKAREPLVLRDMPKLKPGPGQLLVRVTACAVCRTDLHILDGELAEPKLPLILGHQIVGRVEEIGPEIDSSL